MELPRDTPPDPSSGAQLLTADWLLDTLPWAVLVVDEQRLVQRANQQAARWLGTSLGTLLGRPLAEAGLPLAVSAGLLPESGETPPREVWLPQPERWVALAATRQPGGWVVYGQDITPQKQREQQYQALADNTPDALTRWTPDLRLRYANAAFAAHAGRPLAGLLGCTTREIGQPEAVAGSYAAALQQVFDTGQPQEHFYQLATPRGEAYYHARLVPELHDGEIETVLGIARDVTTLRRAEQAARHGHDLLHSVFEAVPHSIMVLEAVRDEQQRVVDFRYQLTNGVADRHMGVALHGRRLRHLLPGYLTEENFQLLVETVETGQPTERTQHYDSLGGPLWLHSRYRKLGERVVVSHEDVTASRLAQQEAVRLRDELAQRATDKYHALFYGMDQGFCVLEVLFDAAGQQAVDCRYQELNPVFAEQSGLPADAQGQTLRELLPDAEPFWLDTFGQVARTGAAVRLERYLPQLGRWFDVHAFRMNSPEARQVAVLFTDITARKHTEAQLRQAAAAEAFQLRLADALRPLADATAVEAQATRLLGEALGANRVFFALVEDDGTTGVIRSDYAVGIPSGVGRYPLAAFAPQYMPEWRAGRTTRTTDVNTDPRFTEAQRAAYASVSVRAAVGVPLVKDGQLVALLGANHSAPRQWTREEIALLEAVAERTWAAVARARAEQALRESETRFRIAEEALNGFVYDWDPHTNVARRSAGCRLVLGYEPGEVADTATAWQALIHPDYQAVAERLVLPPGEANVWNEYQVRRRDGTYAYVLDRSLIIRDEAGRLVQLVGSVVDISARRQAEEAVARSEAKYRTLFESTDAGVSTVEALFDDQGRAVDYRILEVNPAHKILCGMGPEVVGKRIREVMPTLDEAVIARVGRVVLTGEPVRFEEYVSALDCWFDTYVARVGGAGSRTVVSIFSDITARKQTEQQLAELSTQLEQRVARRTRQLQQSRDLLQSVFDTSLLSLSVLEAVRDASGAVRDFRLLLVSQELVRETGRTDLVGKLYAEEYPGIREAGIFDLALRALATGEPQGMEYYYGHEGFTKWFACQFVKLGDGLVASNLDITERKVAELERTRNLRLLEQAEAVAGLGSWDYNLLSKEFLWSDGMYQLFGVPQGQPVRPDIYLHFVIAEDRPRAERLVAGITAGTGSFEETLRLQVGGQVRTVRVKVVVLYDDAGQAVRVLGVDLDISELHRLEADNLRLRLSQQQALFEAVQAAQEEERKRMAESLHNGIGQVLYATKLRLDLLHSLPEGAPPAEAQRAVDQLLVEAIRQTRALSHELVPLALENQGLVKAWQEIGRALSCPQLRLHSQVLLDAEAAPLSPALQLALYRMAQELAQNIVRHAHGATQASLELETTPGWVLLRAEDDGPGFVPLPPAEAGLGLRSIRDRVALLGGVMETGTRAESGAYVRIRIPLRAI